MSAGTIIPSDVRTLPPPSPLGEGSVTPQAAKGAAMAELPPQKAALFSRPPVSAGELFKQTAAALRLPVDTLSVTLLAFSRLFSLPPSQALITTLRRDVLSSSDSSPQTAAEKAAVEAKAMAVAAAADKGVALSPEALERYARFLDAPAFTEDGEAAGGKDTFAGSEKRNSQNREELPNTDELRAIAEEEAQEDGLLDFLNAIPGKNGQHWEVFPFTINVRGIELTVFVRILKGENEQVIVDIAGPKRQYRCFLKKNDNKLRADIRVYPKASPRVLEFLSKKVEHFFGKAGILAENSLEFEQVIVKNGEEMPSWAEILLAEYLPSIDKEV